MTDAYQYLDIDNVVDIYASDREDEALLTTLRELLPPRLDAIEARLRDGGGPAMTVSYKIEMNAIYTSGIATAEFAARRIASPIADQRQMIAEIRMIVDGNLLPPANLFYRAVDKVVVVKGDYVGPALLDPPPEQAP